MLLYFVFQSQAREFLSHKPGELRRHLADQASMSGSCGPVRVPDGWWVAAFILCLQGQDGPVWVCPAATSRTAAAQREGARAWDLELWVPVPALTVRLRACARSGPGHLSASRSDCPRLFEDKTAPCHPPGLLWLQSF